jgi:hypothetical protein
VAPVFILFAGCASIGERTNEINSQEKQMKVRPTRARLDLSGKPG